MGNLKKVKAVRGPQYESILNGNYIRDYHDFSVTS